MMFQLDDGCGERAAHDLVYHDCGAVLVCGWAGHKIVANVTPPALLVLAR
jgi:hypothetical protein